MIANRQEMTERGRAAAVRRQQQQVDAQAEMGEQAQGQQGEDPEKGDEGPA